MFVVAHAHYALGFGLGFAKCGKEHARENRDAGYYHQQLDQRESSARCSSLFDRFVFRSDVQTWVGTQQLSTLAKHPATESRSCSEVPIDIGTVVQDCGFIKRERWTVWRDDATNVSCWC